MSTERFKQERLKAIVDDRRSGAAELGRLALHFLADYARVCPHKDVGAYKRELLSFAGELQRARPGMAPLVNLVGAWRQWLEAEMGPDVERLGEVAVNTAHDLVNQSEQAVVKIAGHVADVVPAGSTVFTHSISSTILVCFRELAARNVKAIVTESRPGDEGRWLAGQLAELAVTADFITDAQMGLFIGRADIALVGADTVLDDGSIINKAGTYLLALAAREAGVPFYVCAERFKRGDRDEKNAQLDEVDGEELGLPILPHITPRNIYFDVTPAELITGWINEDGVQRY